MEQNLRNLRTVTAIFLASIVTLLSGCVSDSYERRPQASRGTIDVCHTQATHTRCHREKVTDFAEQMEALREQEEMAQLESLDDW